MKYKWIKLIKTIAINKWIKLIEINKIKNLKIAINKWQINNLIFGISSINYTKFVFYYLFIIVLLLCLL